MKSEKFYKRREQSQTRLAFAESRRKMGKANLLPRDLHLQQLHQSVSLIVQRYNIWKPRFPLCAGSYRYRRITQDKDTKKRSQQCDYVSRSMQNLSAIHFTMCGGSTLMPGFSPIRVSSLRYGLHQLNSVRTVTPAHWASCCFVIAFITILFSFRNYHTFIT